MFAIVSYQGNQYKVSPDKECKIDLVNSADKKIVFDQVLLLSDGKKVSVGAPNLENVSVEAEIVGTKKDDKVTGLKFHSKKRYKRNLGHRQEYSVIKILKINSKNEK